MCMCICSRESRVVSYWYCCHCCGWFLCQYFYCRTLLFRTDDFRLCFTMTQFHLLLNFCSDSPMDTLALSPWCMDHGELLQFTGVWHHVTLLKFCLVCHEMKWRSSKRVQVCQWWEEHPSVNSDTFCDLASPLVIVPTFMAGGIGKVLYLYSVYLMSPD